MSIMLPIVLFVGWIAIHFAAVGERAVEDAKAGVPEDQRGGVTFLPGIPLMPLFFWYIAYGGDSLFYPWGSVSFMAIHIIFLIWAVYHIVKYSFILKQIETDRI